jgi:hypothetical protein
MATLAGFALSRLRTKLAGGVELQQPNNLLKLKLGSLVTINDADHSEMEKVVGINIIIEHVGGRDYPITEYIMDSGTRLWVYPAEDKDQKFLTLVLSEYYSADYDQALADGLYHPAFQNGDWVDEHPETDVGRPALQDPEGLFRVTDTDEEGNVAHEAIYQRRFGDVQPHSIAIRTLSDENNDGTLQESEIRSHHAQYWDYELKNGTTEDRPYLIGIENHAGQFTLLTGSEIPFEALMTIQ